VEIQNVDGITGIAKIDKIELDLDSYEKNEDKSIGVVRM